MSEHTFTAFLRSRRRQWNEKQSKLFVDQYLTEPSRPDHRQWDELRDYLEGKGADQETIGEVEYIWGLYMDDNHGQVG